MGEQTEPALHQVAGVRIGIAMAAIRKANRPRPRRSCCSIPAPPSPACSPRTASAPRRCSSAARTFGGGSEVRALAHQHRQRQRRHRRRRPGARALDVRGAGRLLGCAPEQVLPFSTGVIMETLPNDRIEAGSAGGAGRCAARPLGRGRAGDHDHRHRAQGGVAHGAARRQAGRRHRHQQGRRHDPAEHGDDARLRRHRRGDRSVADAAARSARRPTSRSTASRSTATRRPTIRSC